MFKPLYIASTLNKWGAIKFIIFGIRSKSSISAFNQIDLCPTSIITIKYLIFFNYPTNIQ